jgi:DnaJ-class molecular chaperone
METGDIIFLLVEKKHDLFRRNGNDLLMETEIPLIEALAGFSFVIKHLDGREILIKSAKGDVITHSKKQHSNVLSIVAFLSSFFFFHSRHESDQG